VGGGFAAGRAVVVSPEVVSGSPFAVLGLESTTGVPPLVTETAVYQVAGGVVRAGPLVWPVAVDAPMVEIPHRSRPNMRFAPPWSRVTGYLLAVLDRRVLVMHDECRLAVLRRHLPDWEPDRVLFTRGLAQRVWPGLDSYDVEPLARAVGISPLPGVNAGAAVEAYAVVMLLSVLARRAVGQASRRRRCGVIRDEVPLTQFVPGGRGSPGMLEVRGER